jgi:hypothetical protein
MVGLVSPERMLNWDVVFTRNFEPAVVRSFNFITRDIASYAQDCELASKSPAAADLQFPAVATVLPATVNPTGTVMLINPSSGTMRLGFIVAESTAAAPPAAVEIVGVMIAELVVVMVAYASVEFSSTTIPDEFFVRIMIGIVCPEVFGFFIWNCTII